MNRLLSIPLCFGVLSLLSVMISIELVHGWPHHTRENELFPDKEDINRDELLLALLNRNFDLQRSTNIGCSLENPMEHGSTLTHLELPRVRIDSMATDIELANKLEELNQLEKLTQQLMETKSAEMSYAIDGPSSSHPNKRACFWKYCV